MESLKDRMAKAVPVIRRPVVLLCPPYPSSPSEGVIVSRPTVSAVELPVLCPSLLHHQPSMINQENKTVMEPAVHVYATMKQD